MLKIELSTINNNNKKKLGLCKGNVVRKLKSSI